MWWNDYVRSGRNGIKLRAARRDAPRVLQAANLLERIDVSVPINCILRFVIKP